MNRIEKDTFKVSFSIPFNIFFDEQSYLCLLLAVFDARICKRNETLTNFLLKFYQTCYLSFALRDVIEYVVLTN